MLRMSTLFLRTLRDDPADAEVPSHRLLVRAGYIRRIAAGIYSWLPLGVITLRNIENVVRDEMNAAGFQEVHFPAMLPKDAYEQTNRWTEYGPDLFRLQDRKGTDYLLGPTHEEMFTLMVKGEVTDHVTLDGVTSVRNDVTVDGKVYDIYTLGSQGAQVLLEDDGAGLREEHRAGREAVPAAAADAVLIAVPLALAAPVPAAAP